MARATNGLGQFRGKVGSVVFRVSQGQQIASAYQPAVRNPKTNLQTAQRNKMYLASQLSKLVPREDLIGLAPNMSARDRRSLFVKNIINNTTSTLDGELFSSKIAPEKIVFSHGENSLYISAIVPELNNVQLQINTQIGEDVYNKMAIKIIMMDISNGQYRAYKSYWADLPAYSSAQNGVISVDLDVVGAGVSIWAIPVVLNDGYRYSSERKSLIQIDEYNNIIITGMYSISSAVYEWWQSLLLVSQDQKGEVIPPNGDGDEVVNPDGPNFPNLG